MPHTLQPTHIQHCSSTTLQRTILRIPPIFDGGIEKIRNSEGQHRDTHRHLYQASLIITYSNLSAPRELRHCLHSASASLKPGRRWMATLMCFYYQSVIKLPLLLPSPLQECLPTSIHPPPSKLSHPQLNLPPQHAALPPLSVFPGNKTPCNSSSKIITGLQPYSLRCLRTFLFPLGCHAESDALNT